MVDPIAILQTRGENKTLIKKLIGQLIEVKECQRIVIALPKESEMTIEDIGFSNNDRIHVFTGDSKNVLGRLVAAANHFGAETVVRVTDGDLFLNPALVRQLVKIHLGQSLEYSILRRDRIMAQVEVVSTRALNKLYQIAKEKDCLEDLRISWFFQENIDNFKNTSFQPKSFFDNGFYSDLLSFYDFPRQVIVELTNACNLKCIICPRRYMNSKVGFMDYGLYRRLIDEIAFYREVEVVPFFRGESLLHKSFLNAVKYAKEKGIILHVTSNGFLLNPDISEELVALEVDFINLSIDGMNKEEYERIRVGSNFDRVMNNIEALLRMKEIRGNNKPEISISMVKTDTSSSASVDKFIKRWTPMVDKVIIYEEHTHQGKFGKYKVLDGFDIPPAICPSVLTDLVVYWNGRTALCCQDWDRRQSLGDVNKLSIKEIWNGEIYKEIRRRHWEGKLREVETCRSCNYWKSAYLDENIVCKVSSQKR